MDESPNEAQTQHPLHMELINYAVESCRLFYIQHVSAWQEWTTTNESFQDLSAYEVRHMFLADVLPQLDTYEPSETVKRRLKLFDLLPSFRRVAQGYRYTPDPKMAARFALQRGVDYILTSDIEKCKDNKKMSHTVLLDDEGAEPKTCVGYQSKLSEEVAVFLTVMLSSDTELVNEEMLDVAEIHRRLRIAKQNFEDKAILTPFRPDADELINNVGAFRTYKSKLCRVISNCKNIGKHKK
ncbi:uncharacterized protein LOC108046195 [Drosophila rhopaloa]|uniref:Uncharacterized protein LOC108046195 n=1 Tax=Drosophila rhopaloa TaxID=1041015 RepID=A0A6P4ET15_DRORH|nr:uncharacterized protein LOC108046195 [Drosophila rhopaloa]